MTSIFYAFVANDWCINFYYSIRFFIFSQQLQ